MLIKPDESSSSDTQFRRIASLFPMNIDDDIAFHSIGNDLCGICSSQLHCLKFLLKFPRLRVSWEIKFCFWNVKASGEHKNDRNSQLFEVVAIHIWNIARQNCSIFTADETGSALSLLITLDSI